MLDRITQILFDKTYRFQYTPPMNSDDELFETILYYVGTFAVVVVALDLFFWRT